MDPQTNPIDELAADYLRRKAERLEGGDSHPDESTCQLPPIPPGLSSAADWYDEQLGWAIIAVRENKTPVGKWKVFQAIKPTSDHRSTWFNKHYDPAGLAVINGAVSGGLVCRDFDEVESYERWKEANPELARQLPTVRTPRGYHVYVLKDGYTQIKEIGDGELRGGGYNILPPTGLGQGKLYQWVNEPNRENLVQVNDGVLFGLMKCWTEKTEQAEQTENTEILKHIEITEADGCHEGRDPFAEMECQSIGPAIEAIINSTLPEGEGQRNRKVFELARRLKAVTENAEVDPRTFKPIVQKWYQLSLGKIRTQEWAVTWVDFLNGFNNVKIAHGEDAVAIAVDRAISNGTPPEVPESESAEIRLLASVCRELQRIKGDKPFFLSCRSAEGFLGVPKSNAALMLKYLCFEGLLKVVEKGKLTKDGGRATRYRYLGRLEQFEPEA
jgi:hypothetical protein